MEAFIRRCAWHGLNFPKEPAPIMGVTIMDLNCETHNVTLKPEQIIISDGCCPKCAVIEHEYIAKMKSSQKDTEKMIKGINHEQEG